MYIAGRKNEMKCTYKENLLLVTELTLINFKARKWDIPPRSFCTDLRDEKAKAGKEKGVFNV